MPSAWNAGESSSTRPHVIATDALPMATAQIRSNEARSSVAPFTQMCEPSRESFLRMVAGISIAASVSRNMCNADCLRSSIGIVHFGKTSGAEAPPRRSRLKPRPTKTIHCDPRVYSVPECSAVLVLWVAALAATSIAEQKGL